MNPEADSLRQLHHFLRARMPPPLPTHRPGLLLVNLRGDIEFYVEHVLLLELISSRRRPWDVGEVAEFNRVHLQSIISIAPIGNSQRVLATSS